MATKRTKRTAKKPRTRSKPDWALRFLAALADSANIRAACEMAQVSRTNVYQRRDSDEDFARAMSEALENAVDLLELEARRRALHGVDEPVIWQGELSGTWVDATGSIVAQGTPGARLIPLTIKKHSDTLAIFLLKAHRPEKYRDNVRHEHTGQGGAPIAAKVTHEHIVDPAALAAFAADLAAAGLGDLPADRGEQPVDSASTAPEATTVPAAR